MTRIRVDPELLRLKSQELGRLAAEMHRIAREAVEIAERAPSYDGQFGPKVRALGAEAFAQLSARGDKLVELAAALEAVADRFEQADRVTQEGLASLELRFHEWSDRVAALRPLVAFADWIGLGQFLVGGDDGGRRGHRGWGQLWNGSGVAGIALWRVPRPSRDSLNGCCKEPGKVGETSSS